MTVSVDVKNTGARGGAEVVQLYIRDEYSSVTRPVNELKGFRKVWLDAGGAQTISFTVDAEAFSFYDKDMRWVVEPGEFEIMVGGASDRTQSIVLKVVK